MVQMTMLFLNSVVQVDVSRRLIILPKVCSWFLNDFAPLKAYATEISSGVSSVGPPGGDVNTPNSVMAIPMHCLVALIPYLQDDLKANCTKLVVESMSNSANGALTIKFHPFVFKARRLVQFEGDNDSAERVC